MRILHFYKTSYPETNGGVEQVIHQLAMGGTHVGIETDVLSLTPNKMSSSIETDGYAIHRACLNFQIASTGFSASAIIKFSQLAKKADIIHYHFPWPFMDMVHFFISPDKPSVVTYHSDIIRQKKLLIVYRPLKRWFLSKVDRIVATSPNYFSTSNVLNQYSDKVSVIPIGLDKRSYAAPSLNKLNYWREKLGNKFFLFVGVLRYYKGLHILLEAASGTDYPIVIVGSGPIEEELKKQAERQGLHNVLFLGYLDDEAKIALFTLCFAVIFPSHLRSEAFGVSLLEGAMFGKPLISSEIGTGTSYININNVTGVVVPPSDAHALRNAMHFLWNNPTEASLMGMRAEERYWQYFTADKMINSYKQLYLNLLA